MKFSLLIGMIALSLILVPGALAMAGDGSPGNPYQITNCQDLQSMNNSLSASYILMNNIDCSDTVNWNSGAGFMPVGGDPSMGPFFTGKLDGQNYNISNLYINRLSTSYVGLFRTASSPAEIKNIGLKDVNIKGRDYVGGLAGGDGGTISNSYSTGSISGRYMYVGGLVGYNYATISNSYSTASVSGGGSVGGLIGSISQGTISNSYSTGSVSSGGEAGGLVGINRAIISNSYSTGSVSGGSMAGGLVGYSNGGTISNSYSTGSVSGGGSVGGLVGWSRSGTTSNSYWDNQTSGQTNCIGQGGQGDFSSCYGKTTAEMRQQATFSGWDFTNTWKITEGVTYPLEKWQSTGTCSDGYQNQDETDVDCGGAICSKCVDFKSCLINSDCLSNICNGGICSAGQQMQDADHDGIQDADDNCVNEINPDQANADGDTWGDVCDLCPSEPSPPACNRSSDGLNYNVTSPLTLKTTDVKVNIPANAYSTNVSLSMQRKPSGIQDYRLCGVAGGLCQAKWSYSFEPEITFNQPIELRFNSSDCLGAACGIFWCNESKGPCNLSTSWVNLKANCTAEPGWCVLSTAYGNAVNHFSEFFLVQFSYPYIGNATVTLAATDTESGLANIFYCIDADDICIPDQIYSDPIFIDTLGISYLRHQSFDNAGNSRGISSDKIEIVQYCDKEPPVINIIIDGILAPVNWLITASDALSGMKSLDYNLTKI